jgi:hypothetical protein
VPNNATWVNCSPSTVPCEHAIIYCSLEIDVSNIFPVKNAQKIMTISIQTAAATCFAKLQKEAVADDSTRISNSISSVNKNTVMFLV